MMPIDCMTCGDVRYILIPARGRWSAHPTEELPCPTCNQGGHESTCNCNECEAEDWAALRRSAGLARREEIR